MKQGKVFGAILSVVNIVLIVVCIFFFLRTDRTAPELIFGVNDLTYTREMDKARLLEGITAYDSKDGDITDRIVIEKLIENQDDNTLIVFYAVSDKAGNIAKASREFGARYINKNANSKEEIDEIKEAGIDAAFDVNAETKENGEMETEPSENPLPTPTETPSPTPTATPSTAPTATPAPAVTPAPTPEETQEQTREDTPVQTPGKKSEAGEAPTFTLKVTEIKTKAGISPALVDIIGKLSDDKDSYETLFHNIKLSKYDVNTPGSYQVTLTTEDSDGNQTQAGPLTIIVE